MVSGETDSHHIFFDDEHECSVCKQKMEEQTVREVAYYEGWRTGVDEGQAAAYQWVLSCCRLILGAKDNEEILRITGLIRDQMAQLGLKAE